MTRTFIFDLDGTLADLTHRLPLIQTEPTQWDAFFDACGGDTPIQHVVEVCQLLGETSAIVIVSDRSDRCRQITEDWLRRHEIPFTELYMRTEGDHRPDNLVKQELLKRLRSEGWNVVMAFDDRTQVVDMWRAEGVPCAQVAPGDF